MILPVNKLFKLIELMDDKLKRTDFKQSQSLGVNFSGYYDPIACRVTSGCTKVHCILSLVKTFSGERSYGISNESVCAWLDKRIPDWRKELGVE